jgi:hypothetical protein
MKNILKTIELAKKSKKKKREGDVGCSKISKKDREYSLDFSVQVILQAKWVDLKPGIILSVTLKNSKFETFFSDFL